MNDEIKLFLEELKKTNRILRVAFKAELDKKLKEFVDDPVAKEILDKIKIKDETSVDLKREISKKLNLSEKTIERRLSEMAKKGVLIETLSGKVFIYKNAGLF